MSLIPSRRLPPDQCPPHHQHKKVIVEMCEHLFVGAYAKAYLHLTNVTIDELIFRIPVGAKGGIVSECRDSDFNPKRPDIMICAGYAPGTYEMEVIERSTDIVLAIQKFVVSTSWNDPKLGPGVSFVGVGEEFTSAPAFGGGEPGPENWNVIPATGTRQIAILFVDFADGKYPTADADVRAMKRRWRNEVINGVTFQGTTGVSTRAYYQEVSNGVFDISATTFGPYHLSNNWDQYFDTSTSQPNWGVYIPAVIAEAGAAVDFRNFQTVLIVSQTAGTQNAWPYASIGSWGPYSTLNGDVYLGVISMPQEWGANFQSARHVHTTVAHELGHNLGLNDQYTPATGRNTGNWELMDAEDSFPHFTAFHLLTLGWIKDKTWVKAYDFAGGGVVVDDTVTLTPIELGAPPSGSFALIEVRIAAGWNYYIEYRNGQPSEVGDRTLDTPNAILVTDTLADPGEAPIARPQILRVPDDPDGDGSVLINGKDYRETDTTDPTFPTDFRISVSGINGMKAAIKIEYGINSRPDPMIRPWPAGPGRQWQSPDIEVRNARSLADPAWFNVPWSGHDNTVVARITNSGDLAALGVNVDFAVKNYTVGGAPEVPLGTDTQDIPARGVVEFTTNWVPPDSGHFCIVVRIQPYVIPDTSPPQLETSVFNNMAQSNYDRFISASASAASREVAYVDVKNPFEERTQVAIAAAETNPLYRTYLEHTHVWLEPGESRQIKVMHEFDPSNLLKVPVSLGRDRGSFIPTPHDDSCALKAAELTKKYTPVPNRSSFVASIIDPRGEIRRPIGMRVFSGVQNEVVTGRKTKFESFYKRFSDGETYLTGRVVADGPPRDSPGVTGGLVIVAFTREHGDGVEVRSYATVKVDVEGRFTAQYDEQAVRIKANYAKAYYVPSAGYSDCWSEQLQLRQSNVSTTS